MEKYFETLGTNTYLSVLLTDEDEIDTMSLGMLTNNEIPGFAASSFTQMDATKYIKYNVSAKVAVSQLFSGSVNRKRLLGVMSGIVEAMLSAEEYMLDPNTVLLDLDYIFTDVSTCETVLICLPVVQDAAKPVDLGMFFKNIIFTTQFDQTENCDHVAQILNYLNRASSLSLEDFKTVLDHLAGGPQPVPVKPKQQPAAAAKPAQPAAPAKPVQPIVTPGPVAPPAMPEPVRDVKPVTQPAPFEIPGGVPVQPTPQPARAPEVNQTNGGSGAEKPMSMFYLLQHYNKENAALYKAQQEAKKSEKNSPEPKKAQKKKDKLPAKKQPQQRDFAIPGDPVPEFDAPIQKIVQPVIPPQPDHRQAQPQPQIQPQPQPQVQPQPQIQPQPQQQTYTAAAINFGETTILGGETGGTTVLGAGPDPATATPYLIRVKTKEKVLLNKPTFKIGKERSYVDYAIIGNSAVSRSHATIITRGRECLVEDTNSTNHTYVNGKMIQSGVPVKIEHGCRLRFADEEFEFKMY